MKPALTAWKPVLGLAFCLIYPSIAIFKKLGVTPLLLYGLVVLVVLALTRRQLVPLLLPKLTPLRAGVALALLLGALLAAYLLIHPHINKVGFQLLGRSFGACDQSDALEVALREILHGRYPYYAKTFLNGPISPLPGAVLLASPFYLFGDVALQNFFWLAVFIGGFAWFHRNLSLAVLVAYVTCLLSPHVVYHILQGGDYLSNGIYVLAACACLVEAVHRRRSLWQCAGWALLAGVAFSSRLNFIILLPLVIGALLRLASWRQALALIAVVLAGFAVVTLPFALFDPAGFSPLHTANKLSINGAFRWAPYVAPLLGGLLAIALAVGRKRYQLPTLLGDMFFVQAFLMVFSLALASLHGGSLNFEWFSFGILFMFFGIFAFGPASLLPAEESNATAPPTNPRSTHPAPPV